MVESQPSKLLVAGSIPVSRSSLRSPETRASYGWRAMWAAEAARRSSAKRSEGGPRYSRQASEHWGEGCPPERGARSAKADENHCKTQGMNKAVWG